MIPGFVRVRTTGQPRRGDPALNEREGEAKLLSGGYSLIPLLKLRLGQPGCSSISRGRWSRGIIHTDDDLRIGGRATHRQINVNDDRP